MRSKKSKVTLLVLVAAVVSLVFWGYSAWPERRIHRGVAEIPW